MFSGAYDPTAPAEVQWFPQECTDCERKNFYAVPQTLVMAQHTYPGHTLIGNVETTKRKAKNEVIRQLKQDREPARDAGSWLIRFQGRYLPQYWIVLLVKKNTTLKAVDSALRDIWLECCGHLSAFTIYGDEYVSFPDDEFGGMSMNARLGSLLSVGLEGEYLYDFGDTTYLTFKVLDIVPFSPKGRKSIELVAQNDPPDIRCSICGEPATEICTECLYNDVEDPFFCDTCFEEHECDEEMSLPVVNSPRMGQCAYMG